MTTQHYGLVVMVESRTGAVVMHTPVARAGCRRRRVRIHQCITPFPVPAQMWRSPIGKKSPDLYII
jgi:hypothetical protein